MSAPVTAATIPGRSTPTALKVNRGPCFEWLIGGTLAPPERVAPEGISNQMPTALVRLGYGPISVFEIPSEDPPSLRWGEEDVTSRGVRQRRFDVEYHTARDAIERQVPGLLWTPEPSEGPRPLVLIGHGGSGSKRQDYVVSLARRLVRHLRFAAAAIDGPVHGDRRAQGDGRTSASSVDETRLVLVEFAQAWASDPTMTDSMVADWRSTLDALGGLKDIDSAAVGYWGMSMGTILGLPLVASEPRISVAVLGLMGLTGPTGDRLGADARRLSVPVLFVVNWDDELFPRDKAFELFDVIGSATDASKPDKRLHAYPGGHGELGEEMLHASETFLASHLTPRGDRPIAGEPERRPRAGQYGLD